MKKIRNFLEKTKEKILLTLVSVYTVSMIATPVYAANDVKNSQIVKGTEKLINDTTTWLMVLAPVLVGLLIIYFCIRRSAADEMDQKRWNNRIVVAIVSCIGAVLGSATLNLIVGYYK
ncbi:hypothetical protein GCM10008908_35310 [Clostridium subterminale]|uniref:TrbC/VIRB2 family protein n=1 Tax=Clostridium subterminale TaxID=1550 RepID=A0ABN1KXI2_CLOSU